MSGHTAAKAARLSELAYSPRSIGKLLAVPAKAVERYLRKRNLPIGDKRLRSTRSPWFATDPSEAWRYHRDAARPSPTELPSLKAPAANAEIDQVDAAETSPPQPAWSGRSSFKASGEQHGRTRLTNADAVEIRRLHSEGWTYASLARKYKVHRQTIWNVVSHRTWPEV